VPITVHEVDIRLTLPLTTSLTQEEVAGELRLSPATIGEMVDGGPPPKPHLLGPATRRDRGPLGERPGPGGLASTRREPFEGR
jgi:hypothetical protein